eukprot:COSAG03_NODE_486_length_7531_cov_49.515608_7_plen_174_part_00
MCGPKASVRDSEPDANVLAGDAMRLRCHALERREQQQQQLGRHFVQAGIADTTRGTPLVWHTIRSSPPRGHGQTHHTPRTPLAQRNDRHIDAGGCSAARTQVPEGAASALSAVPASLPRRQEREGGRGAGRRARRRKLTTRTAARIAPPMRTGGTNFVRHARYADQEDRGTAD